MSTYSTLTEDYSVMKFVLAVANASSQSESVPDIQMNLTWSSGMRPLLSKGEHSALRQMLL
jgi:hypothetical protein